MRIEQEKVEQFHKHIKQLINERPTLLHPDLCHRRADYMEEELKEYRIAADNQDLVEIADSLADLIYLVLGTAVVHGIDLQPIFDEVHRSNMTKNRVMNSWGKGGKGPNFVPPRIADLLVQQRYELEP